MLTTDVAMRVDPDYARICHRFLQHPEEFADAFARAWYKLTHRDMGPITRYLGPEVAAEHLIWQDPLPEPAEAPLDADAVGQLKSRVLAAGIPVADLVWLAWSCASTFRRSDKRGGANGARIRLEPQNGWEVNEPHRLAGLLARLEEIRAAFASSRPAGHGVSLADLIVLAGTAAVEKAAADAGHELRVPFTPGRVDATREHTDIDGFSHLEPAADGFRNHLGKDDTLPAEYRLVDRADLLGLSARELTALVGGLRTLGATYQSSDLGVLTARPGVLTNDWYVNLLDQDTTWTPTAHDPALFEGRDARGSLRWTASRTDLVFGSNAELRALAEVYASAGGEQQFATDFAAAWAKVMDLDRYDLPSHHS